MRPPAAIRVGQKCEGYEGGFHADSCWGPERDVSAVYFDIHNRPPGVILSYPARTPVRISSKQADALT